MNAINHSEVQAIETANQDVVIPEQSSIVVPLSQLRVSKRNVRKIRSSGPSIDALAASIARVGLLLSGLAPFLRTVGLTSQATASNCMGLT